MEIPMTGSSIRNSHSRDGGKIPLSLERGTQWLEGPLSHDRHETIRFRETSDSNRLMQDDFLSTTSAHSKDVYCPQWTMHSHPQGNFPPHPEGKGGLAHSQHSIDHAGRPTWPAYPAPWPPLPFWGHPPHGESPISGDHDIAPRILVAPELVDRRHVLEHLQSLNSYLFAIGFLLDGQFRPGVTQLCRNIVLNSLRAVPEVQRFASYPVTKRLPWTDFQDLLTKEFPSRRIRRDIPRRGDPGVVTLSSCDSAPPSPHPTSKREREVTQLVPSLNALCSIWV